MQFRDFTVACASHKEVQKNILKWMLNLVERHAKRDYEHSEIGWSRQDKEDELNDPEALFLVASKKNDDLIGYVHYRFVDEETMKDDTVPVIYM